MMDCKNTLSESQGDIIKAQELLRKRAELASADKKASRTAAKGRMVLTTTEGRIGSMNSYLLLSYLIMKFW